MDEQICLFEEPMQPAAPEQKDGILIQFPLAQEDSNVVHLPGVSKKRDKRTHKKEWKTKDNFINNARAGQEQTVYAIKSMEDRKRMAAWLLENKDRKYFLAFTLGINRTQHDIHIGQRTRVLGRVHAEQIGEGRELLVGESFCQSVHETNQIARRRALIFIDSLALLALTLCEVSIVLTDRNHVHSWIGFEYRVNLRTCHLENLLIGEAPLAVITWLTFSFDI